MFDQLLDLGTIGVLSLLTVATVLQWTRHRDRTQAYLAWTIGLLAVLTLSGELDDLLGIDAVSQLGIVALLGAGYALLIARHTLSPVPLWVLGAAACALTAVAVGILGIGVGSGDGSTLAEQAVSFGALAVLFGCVGEPAFRFWRLARDLPAIRAARLRALAVGFGLILLVFVIAVAAPESPASDAAVDWSRLVILGFLYISFAPPKPLRRMWREREERSRLQSGPLFAGQDRHAQARAGLEWAVRLVGAESGFLAAPDGAILAVHGIDEPAARELLHETEGEGGVVYVGSSPSRPAVVAPLSMETGRGTLAVIAGPLTPLFGREERQLVEHWANGVAAALDRLQLEELRQALLTAVSHEVRTPLTALLGIAETLAHPGAETIPAKERRRLVDGLLRNTRRLDWLLADINDVHRLTTGTLELRRTPTDVLTLAEEVLDRWEDLKGRTRLDGPRLRADVDPAMVSRMLENLLANAARHTPDGTSVWVRTERLPDEEGVLLVVEDDGPGVPPAIRQLVFEPFRRGPTAPAHSPGAGVGLTLVARLAEAHGGRTWVDERPGGGASFKVALPESRGAEASPEQTTGTSGTTPPSGVQRSPGA